MRRMMANSLLAAALLFTPILLAAQTPQTDGQQKTVIHVAQGDLAGIPAQPYSSILLFRGIPYAAPPVGDLRWREPQPPAPWTGVRDAARYGDICYQAGS